MVSKRMSIDSLQIHKNVRDLFDNFEVEMETWKQCKFEIIFDDKNEKKIKGNDVVDELKDIKRTLEIMKDNLCEYYDEYLDKKEESYMIYDMCEYIIDDDRWWIFEYEIDVYLEIVDEKLKEYNKLYDEIENELNVSAGIAIALLRL